jgi:DNA-binding LytR/AlgR family response regulator
MHTGEQHTRLELEGRVAGALVSELRKTWEEAQAAGHRSMIVNLAAVSYVDGDGKRLLSDMCRAGVAFQASGCLMRSLVEELTQACHREPTGVQPGSRDDEHCESR